MAITAALVKELREMTGAGMMDCKKALVETDGDLQKAADYMRENGMAKAAKKAGRVAAEGLVLAKCDGKVGAVIEVNIETDFAAKNEGFITLANTLLDHVLAVKPADVQEMLGQTLFNGDKTVEDYIRDEGILKIGENIQLRRFEVYELEGNGVVESYIHGGGKIGVMIEALAGKEETVASDDFKALVHDIALHIAAGIPQIPQYIAREDVTSDDIDKEREILRVQVLNEGKPEAIVDKIVDGKINNFYKEVCLLEQGFVKEPKETVKSFVDALAKKYDDQVAIVKFTRFALGEGIEKKEEDFAEEVAKQLNK